MPHRVLRFCPKCLQVGHGASRDRCGACNLEVLPLMSEDGALSREFLLARNSCCDSGCRNCPYKGAATESKAAAKTCGRCGADFACGGEQCWCNGVRLSDATLQWMRRNYSDCLCPKCLQVLAGQ